MTEPRRVLIAWDISAHGIWWVLTKEEKEAPVPRGSSWTGSPRHDLPHRPRPWSDELTGELLDELQEWNDAWDIEEPDSQALQERGRELAARVQDELGRDGWEVLYQMGDRMYRVHPRGSWPIGTWEQELLGYRPRMPDSEHPTG